MENEVLDMIDVMAERTKEKEREIQRRQNLEVEEAARGGNLTPVSGASRIVAGNPNLSEVADFTKTGDLDKMEEEGLLVEEE